MIKMQKVAAHEKHEQTTWEVGISSDKCERVRNQILRVKQEWKDGVFIEN